MCKYSHAVIIGDNWPPLKICLTTSDIEAEKLKKCLQKTEEYSDEILYVSPVQDESGPLMVAHYQLPYAHDDDVTAIYIGQAIAKTSQ